MRGSPSAADALLNLWIFVQLRRQEETGDPDRRRRTRSGWRSRIATSICSWTIAESGSRA
jgi:hypothetical protein